MSDNKERVFFIHFRANRNGSLTSAYPAHARAHGGATVAYTFDDKGVKFAVAKVSPKDRYEKAIGRKVSSERLGTDQAGYWPGSVHAFRHAITQSMYQNV